jgi:hypothetical protein
MSSKLFKAFLLTDEEHSDAFEHYANAFLVDDYPELQALGGKKDKGMDARIVQDKTGKTLLVLQSCVSPASRARAKILDTIKKLHGNMPEEFIYCTSAVIGTELDETKVELRRDHKVRLQVCDAAWFDQRHKMTHNRAAISDAYARSVLDEFIRDLTPDRLYSPMLNENEERVAVQYLEAVSLDRSKDSDLTKGIFDALIASVTRDSSAHPPIKVYTENEIIASIAAMFPQGHAARTKELVPERLAFLVKKKALHINKPAGGYVLSFEFRAKVNGNIARAQERELAFLAALAAAVAITAEDREIDYDFPADKLVEIGHRCVLWYLREQGKYLADPSVSVLNILNAEKLVEAYLAANPLPKGDKTVTQDSVLDILPHALFITFNSKDEEIKTYLRAKADLFIIHAFLQVTADVQQACRKLLAGDILYLDTSILVRCIAEYFSPPERRPVLNSLEGARRLGCQLRTWRPYINELVSHLKGPVLQEWQNHFRGLPRERIETALRTAPPLIGVFHRWIEEEGGSIESIVEEVIGKTNEVQNVSEFLSEEFGIATYELPPQDGNEQEEWQKAFGLWLDGKLHHKNMSADRFELLVRNDVNAYTALVRLRRENEPDGPNYGYKIWYLTLDRMPWRIARAMSPDHEAVYEVAMSLSYLMNCVATLANAGVAKIPENLIPATTILDETEMVPSELRTIYQSEWKPWDKKYKRERRIRELNHKLKASMPLGSELAAAEGKIAMLPDEDI